MVSCLSNKASFDARWRTIGNDIHNNAIATQLELLDY
jgi:hypothetical protein